MVLPPWRANRVDSRGVIAKVLGLILTLSILYTFLDQIVVKISPSTLQGTTSLLIDIIGNGNLTLCAAPVAFINDDLSPKVAIIGAAGYIGSALHRYLREDLGYRNVRGYDRNPRATKFKDVAHCDGRGLQDQYLHQFDVVVYLGGLTNRKACQAHEHEEVYEQNIQEVVDMAKRMHSDQLLVFAATSAVAEGSGATKYLFQENDEPNMSMMDAYTLSIYRREVALRELAADANYRGPTLVGTRFGTVVGVSPSQRTEFGHVAMVRSALLEGRIKLKHPETWRPFLWIPDQMRALEAIIRHHQSLSQTSRFHLYHLSSFNSRVGQAANEVAAAVLVPQDVVDHEPSEDNAGFLLDKRKIMADFKIEFEGNPRSVVMDLLQHKDHVLMGRELLDHDQHVQDAVPCRVCGSHEMMEVLDLGMQPLANDFRPTIEESHQCERHPLRLMRCRQCNHAQLSTLVDREPLFTNYTYRSATSKTLDEYFAWLAEKVDEEINGKEDKRRVLELACNDGSQLNYFKRLGWETYGVDPATNLVPYAREQGHKVWNEMWGAAHRDKYVHMPGTFDAIIGQNVLAHVPNPVDFLMECVERMHEDTRVYMQISQCNMFADGQFDTVYHEHISFFSPHSFRHLAEEVGLHIVNWQITPIHGGSCLVTMMKKPDNKDESFSQALQLEEARGQLEDVFYINYRAQTQGTRDWLNQVLESMAGQGHDIVGYGAAAKGMVLLHFMLAQQPKYILDYVVDDAPLKQNTYCPGTSIPVKPTSELSKHHPTRPLTIIVFSWNFWEEIRERIVHALMQAPYPHKVVWIVLPFPQQQVLILRGEELKELSVLQVNPYRRPQGPFPRTPKVAMVMHFYNEELLIPYFIRHHAGMFDHAILIDSTSDDYSRELVAEYAPSHWTVVNSSLNGVFDSAGVDAEVMEQEKHFLDLWRIALCTTEFVVHPDLAAELDMAKAKNASGFQTLQLPAYFIVGDDANKLGRFSSLIGQRSLTMQEEHTGAYQRYFVRATPDGNYYGPGRHYPLGRVDVTRSIGGFLAKMHYSPWPEGIPRKMQIGKRVPASDLAKNWGAKHIIKNEQELEEMRARDMTKYGTADLRYLCGNGTNDDFKDARTAWYQVTAVSPFYRESADYCRIRHCELDSCK